MTILETLCAIDEQAIANEYPEGEYWRCFRLMILSNRSGIDSNIRQQSPGQKGRKELPTSGMRRTGRTEDRFLSWRGISPSNCEDRLGREVLGEAAADFVLGKVPDIGNKRSSTGQPRSGIFGWAGVGGSRLMAGCVEDLCWLNIERGDLQRESLWKPSGGWENSDCLQLRSDHSRFEGITRWISMPVDRVDNFWGCDQKAWTVRAVL
jgi:hypothetical protein